MSRSRDVSAVQNNLGVAIPPAAAGKNAVINGGFDIWQRGTSFTMSSTAFTADRWNGYRTTTGSTVSRQVTGDTTNLPNIQYCARVQRDNGNTSGVALYFGQAIETINSIPFAGQIVTLSFYARKGANYSETGSILSATLFSGTGTDQNNMTGAYTGLATVATSNKTLTTTWQRFTISGTVATTATELTMQFNYTPSGTAGAADYFEITGVQLELGSSATPFSRAGGTIQGELAACQRYYQLLASGTSPVLANSFGYSTTEIDAVIPLKVSMRTTPSLIASSGTNYYTAKTSSGTINISNAWVLTASNTETAYIYVTVTGATEGRAYLLQCNNASSSIAFSAEL